MHRGHHPRRFGAARRRRKWDGSAGFDTESHSNRATWRSTRSTQRSTTRGVGRSTKKVHNRGGHRSTAGFPFPCGPHHTATPAAPSSARDSAPATALQQLPRRESPPWTGFFAIVDLTGGPPQSPVVDRCVDFVDRHVARFECDSESKPALPSRFLRRRAVPTAVERRPRRTSGAGGQSPAGCCTGA